MKKLLFLFAVLFSLSSAHAQLPDGSIAPDFTLTDYYGTDHNLYSYLNSGKTVIMEIFAAHCPGCWSYHQTNRLKNMYDMYGPAGTDEIMVLALEHDQWNDSNAFMGNGPAWVTQGDWLTGTPYPIFDVEDPDRGVFTDYNLTFYPVVYMICPDKLTERVSTGLTETMLYQKVQDCQTVTSVPENSTEFSVYIDQVNRSLVISDIEHIRNIQVLNLQGQLIKEFNGISSSTIPFGDVNTGAYLFQINTHTGVYSEKLYLN